MSVRFVVAFVLALIGARDAFAQAGPPGTASVTVQSAAPAAAQAAAPSPSPQKPAAPPAAPPRVVAGQDGFAIESGNGDFRLQIGLLVQADGRFALEDEQRAGHRQLCRSDVSAPTCGAGSARRFEFYLNPDYAGGTLVLQDAYVDTIFAPAFRIRAGKGKTPFGMERLHSASNLMFIDRALPDVTGAESRLGVQVLGDISGGVVSYLGGVMNGVTDGGSADVETNDSKDVSGRFIVRPFNKQAAGSAARGLGLAISGSRGRATGVPGLPAFRTVTLQQPYFSYVNGPTRGGRRRAHPVLAAGLVLPQGVWRLGEYMRRKRRSRAAPSPATSPMRRGRSPGRGCSRARARPTRPLASALAPTSILATATGAPSRWPRAITP